MVCSLCYIHSFVPTSKETDRAGLATLSPTVLKGETHSYVLYGRLVGHLCLNLWLNFLTTTKTFYFLIAFCISYCYLLMRLPILSAAAALIISFTCYLHIKVIIIYILNSFINLVISQIYQRNLCSAHHLQQLKRALDSSYSP